MVLSLLVFIAIALVIYFHYLQGLFSAAISAILAIACALAAIGWYEPVVAMLPRSQFSDQMSAVVLVGLFVIPYIILRTIFDRLVPGNVRFPSTIDKVGAGAMGLIAAICAIGVLLLAVQSMPIGARILWKDRFPVERDKVTQIRTPERSRQEDATFDELDPEAFQNDDSSGVIIPADSILLSLVKHVSEAGSAYDGPLSTGRPFGAIHPDLTQELYGQRIGVQEAAQHTASFDGVNVQGVFTAPSFATQDQESMGSGYRAKGSPSSFMDKLSKGKPEGGRMLLVVRVRFAEGDADKGNNMFSFSPGSVRLVAKVKDEYRNYFPIGTVEGGKLWVNAPDDYLFAAVGKGADLVFEVDEDAVTSDSGSRKMAPGTFIEVKRYARAPLAGKPVTDFASAPSPKDIQLVRKGAAPGAAPSNPTNASQQPAVATDSPLDIDGQPAITGQLFTPIGTGSTNKDEPDGLAEWGQFSLKDGLFTKLELEPSRGLRVLASAPGPVNALSVPDGKRLIQVHARPHGDNTWAWAAAVSEYKLVDGGGQKYAPAGFLAKLDDNGQERLLGRYYTTKSASTYSPPTEAAKMRTTEVWLLFIVPPGIELRAMNFRDREVRPLPMPVP